MQTAELPASGYAPAGAPSPPKPRKVCDYPATVLRCVYTTSAAKHATLTLNLMFSGSYFETPKESRSNKIWKLFI
jgi:hypothetical protein